MVGPSLDISWVPLAFTLTSCIGFTLVGRLSDIFGRRYFFIVSVTMCLVGCAVAATAKNVNQLIGATVLIGMAAAAQISFIYIIAELAPVRHGFILAGLINGINIPIAVFGPLIARSLILHTSAGWRWKYYICIILSVSHHLPKSPSFN